MTTKSRPSEKITQMVNHVILENGMQSTAYRDNMYTGSDVISYEDGKKLKSGHWPWKSCTHRHETGWKSTSAGSTLQILRRKTNGALTVYSTNCVPLTGRWDLPRLPALPSNPFDEGAYKGILDQIDLNKGESVLLYSGVLQAVPLVGSAFKLSSILNKAARNLSKSFRKKPFTTVVKSLISADFIDRFVISPTIDDARRFADATNYVLNVIQSARERSAHRFALDSTVKSQISRDDKTFSNMGTAYSSFSGTTTLESFVESKAFALLEARYDLDASTPLRLWARRTGLTRPLDSVWDLVPFSFVVDYFTRAGDFISALSDEMSDVDGLRGKITCIHDLWATHKVVSRYTMRATHATGVGVSSYFENLVPCTLTPSSAVYENSNFSRFRVPNPWQKLMQLQEKIGDYLTINTTLSSTRKRTIAELIIQAKL